MEGVFDDIDGLLEPVFLVPPMLDVVRVVLHEPFKRVPCHVVDLFLVERRLGIHVIEHLVLRPSYF